MQLVSAGLHWSTCLVYLDDIIIYSHNTEDHFKHLKEVLERLHTAGLKLKPSKCYLFQKSVHYLGHIISEHIVETDPQKIQCVKEWPIPTCTEDIQFLGLATYYRKLVKNFAQIAAPLYRLSDKDPEGQLARWLEILGEYQFTVEHRPGNKHSNADGLSRIPCKQCGWQEELEEPPAKEVVMAT